MLEVGYYLSTAILYACFCDSAMTILIFCVLTCGGNRKRRCSSSTNQYRNQPQLKTSYGSPTNFNPNQYSGSSYPYYAQTAATNPSIHDPNWSSGRHIPCPLKIPSTAPGYKYQQPKRISICENRQDTEVQWSKFQPNHLQKSVQSKKDSTQIKLARMKPRMLQNDSISRDSETLIGENQQNLIAENGPTSAYLSKARSPTSQTTKSTNSSILSKISRSKSRKQEKDSPSRDSVTKSCENVGVIFAEPEVPYKLAPERPHSVSVKPNSGSTTSENPSQGKLSNKYENRLKKPQNTAPKCPYPDHIESLSREIDKCSKTSSCPYPETPQFMPKPEVEQDYTVASRVESKMT